MLIYFSSFFDFDSETGKLVAFLDPKEKELSVYPISVDSIETFSI